MTAAATVDLTGKVALVTGAIGGMGQVIVSGLANLGAAVAIVVRSQARGDSLGRRIYEQVGARHPKLALLVNNAGAHYRNRTLNADGEECRSPSTTWHRSP